MIAQGQIKLATCTSEELGYIVWHRGIIFNADGTDYVLHHTFDGVEVIPLATFLKRRKILSTKPYTLKHPVDIDTFLARHKDDKFELINNNCETFVNSFINTYSTAHRCPFSQQVIAWVIIIFIILLIIKNKQ